MKVYHHIAGKLQALKNCQLSNNKEGELNHLESLERIQNLILPSGSGIDSGCVIETDCKNPEQMFEIHFGFHHMDSYGGYSNWTEHTCKVYASLTGNFSLRITGKNQNDIKEYLYQIFDACLWEEF